jgi:hypothetical protein
VRRGLPFIFVLLLLASARGWSAPRVGLEQAIGLYDSAKFSEATRAFESILADPTTAPADQDLARLYLAATFLAANDKESARAHLFAILKDKPASYAIDAVAFPPDLLALADSVRAEIERSRPAAVAIAPVKSEPVQVVAPDQPRSRMFLVPVGIGVAATAVGGAMLFLASDRYQQLRATSGPQLLNGPQVREEGRTFQTVGLVGVGVGIAALGTGVVMFLVGGGSDSAPRAMISVGPNGAVAGIEGLLP